MISTPTFADLVNDGAIWAGTGRLRLDALQQSALGEASEYSLDLAEPLLRLFAGRAALDFVPHLIASIAAGPRTVLWAWDLPELADLPAVAASARIREFGARHQVDALAPGEHPFAEFVDDPDGGGADATLVAHRIAIAACQVLGEIPYYVFDAQGGSRGVVLLEPRVPLAPATGLDLVRATTQALAQGELTQHRRAVDFAARRLGWNQRAEGDEVVIEAPDQPVGISFDAGGRITGIQTG